MDEIVVAIFAAITIILILYIYSEWNSGENTAINSFNDTFNAITSGTSSAQSSDSQPVNQTTITPPLTQEKIGTKILDGIKHIFTPTTLKMMGEQAAFSVGLTLIAKAIDKKLVQKTGVFVLKLANKVLVKLGEKIGAQAMAKLGARLAIKLGTNVLAKAGSTLATEAATSATMGPAGIVVLATEVVMLGLQIGLDVSDAGGYMKMGTRETYLKIRDEIDAEFKKAITSQNLPYPIIYGPLDILSKNDEVGYSSKLQSYSIAITQDVNEPLMTNFHTAMQQYIASNPDGTEDDLSNWISDNFDNLVDMNAIMTKAQTKLCTENNGKMYGDACTYATAQDCKASFTWPPGSNANDTYVEWDSDKQACVVASTGLYDACASNNISYDWNNRICAIDQNYCASKGASWGYNSNIKQNDCMISPTQEVFENIFGTTITRGLIQVFSSDQYCPCEPGQTDEGLLCQGCPKAHPNQIGGLCYDYNWVSKPQTKTDCPSNMRDTGTDCWLDTYANGVGKIPNKAPCSTWNSSWRDDGTSCWEDWTCHTNPISCHSLADCLSGNGCGCTGGDTQCSGCGCIKKTLMDRQSCDSGYTNISGLCYKNCKDGYEFAGGNLCQPIGGPGPRVTLAQRMQPCPNGSKNIAGVCWTTPYPSTYAKLRKISYSSKDSSGVLTGNC